MRKKILHHVYGQVVVVAVALYLIAALTLEAK